MGIEDLLRLTVSALMSRTGERQGDLAAGLGQSQAQVSRKQSRKAHWSLEDVDLLAAHYKLDVLDVLAGPTHAVGVLHGAVPSLQGAVQQLAVPAPARVQPPATPTTPATTAEPVSEPAAPGAPPSAPARAAWPAGLVEQEPARPCVLCGQPASLELDGFPQHLTAEECAAAVAAASSSPAAEPHPAAPAVQFEETPRTAATSQAGLEDEQHSAAATKPSPPSPPAPPAPAVVPAAAVPVSAPEPTPAVPALAVPPASVGVRRSAPGYASATLLEQISDRVHDVLAACSGDMEVAQAELVKAAIPDVMALLKSSRVGGRYEHSEFPPTSDILRKKSQKGADEIWEGRPKWRNAAIFSAAKKGTRFEVTALDMNAAYLSAMKAWLPIGQLREDTSGVHDPKKAGVHLITPADWEHDDLPNPLGARMEPGELWVTESTLRLLIDCARQDLTDAPVIHRSLVSGATEGLLEKLRRALAESRKTALANGDELTVAYVKAMYSKFVSTIGESTANREIRRPDWMHIIRSKAFANLWMKAHKAKKAGLQVVEISGTDELHVIGDWQAVFPEGRDLSQVKEKTTYILGGKR